MYRTILVPVDGSKRAEAIFRHVENLARGNDATVVLLKVEEEPINLEHDEIIDMLRRFVRKKADYHTAELCFDNGLGHRVGGRCWCHGESQG